MDYSSTSNSITIESVLDSTSAYFYSVGSVPYYSVSPSTGYVTVNGANVNIFLTYTCPTYTLTFTMSGLPSGTEWNVNVNGVDHTTSGTYITLTFNSGTSNTYFIETIRIITQIKTYVYTPNHQGDSSILTSNTNIAITFTLFNDK